VTAGSYSSTIGMMSLGAIVELEDDISPIKSLKNVIIKGVDKLCIADFLIAGSFHLTLP